MAAIAEQQMDFPVDKDVAEAVADRDQAVVVSLTEDQLAEDAPAGSRTSVIVDEGPKYISLTVRTLSGQEIQFPQLSLEMTVRELKMMIHEQNQDFPPRKQKLIRGSKTLLDEEALGEFSLKNGDVVHLVKLLGDTIDEGDSGLNSAGAVPDIKISQNNPGQNNNLLTVVVPDNAGPGTRLLINPPGREQMSVVVPNGLRPGDRFQVRLPEVQQQRSSMLRRSVSRTPGASGTVMQVMCPPNARRGQQILIEVPNVGRMRVAVPPNVYPGQMFRFRIP